VEQRAAIVEQRYQQARNMEDSGNWTMAASEYDQIIRLFPGYKDTTERLAACGRYDLQARMRQFANAGQWRDVLNIDAELTRKDPDSADYDGLATSARNALAREKESAEKELERLYVRGRSAEVDGNWPGASARYSEIVRLDIGYRDSKKLLHRANLQCRLRDHYRARQWQSVLDTYEKLRRLDPNATEASYMLMNSARTFLQSETAARAHQIYVANHKPLKIKITGNVFARALCWHPASNRIAVATSGLDAQVFDLSSSEPIQVLAVRGGSASCGVTAVALSHDGSQLATTTNNRLRIWRTTDGQLLRQFRTSAMTHSVAFSPNDNHVAGEATGGIRIWNISSGKATLQLRCDFKGGLAFSADGAKLAGGGSGRALIWSAINGSLLLTVEEGNDVTFVAFSPDGAKLATGRRHKTACVWDAANGNKLLELQHESYVTSVAFSPDGTKIATGSGNKELCLWDAANGNKLLELQHENYVTSVAFSPDGRNLATSCPTEILIWPVPP